MSDVYWQFHGHTPNGRPMFRVTGEMLAEEPHWSVDHPNPPLGVRDAVRIGKDKLSELVDCTNEWELVGIELANPREEWWYYRLHFQLLNDCDGNWIAIMGRPFYLPVARPEHSICSSLNPEFNSQHPANRF